MPPGESLHNDVMARGSRVRVEDVLPRIGYGPVALRIGLLGVAVTAAVTGNGWLAGVSVPIFLLIAYAEHLRRGQFHRNLDGLPQLSVAGEEGEADTALPGVSVIVAARNEEAAIEEAMGSLMAVDYPDLEIIVVNDHSTDGTREIVNRLGENDRRVRVMHDPPLRPGWFGKSNAVWCAVEQADPTKKWLLLADADVVFHAKAVRRGVACAEQRGLDLLTCCPYLETGSVFEELVLPVGWRDMLALYPFDKLNDPDVHPVGIGAFMLIRQRAYLESGGHAAFGGRNPEDTLLAATIKRWGGNVGVAWTGDLLRIRCCRGWRDIRDSTICKMRVIGGDRLVYPVYLLGLRALPMALPLPLALVGVLHQLVAGAFSVALTLYSLAGLSAYVQTVRGYDRVGEVVEMRRWIAWLHPLAGLIRSWLYVRAMARILVGAEQTWRGREVSPSRRGAR